MQKTNQSNCDNCRYETCSRQSGVPGWSYDKELTKPVSSNMDSSLEELHKAIETKIQLLKFTHEQSGITIESNITAMERQHKTLATKVEEVHDIQVNVQERIIEEGDNLKEIQGWNAKIKDSVAMYEKAVADLDKSVKEIRDKTVDAAKWKEEKIAAEIREKKFGCRSQWLRKNDP